MSLNEVWTPIHLQTDVRGRCVFFSVSGKMAVTVVMRTLLWISGQLLNCLLFFHRKVLCDTFSCWKGKNEKNRTKVDHFRHIFSVKAVALTREWISGCWTSYSSLILFPVVGATSSYLIKERTKTTKTKLFPERSSVLWTHCQFDWDKAACESLSTTRTFLFCWQGNWVKMSASTQERFTGSCFAPFSPKFLLLHIHCWTQSWRKRCLLHLYLIACDQITWNWTEKRVLRHLYRILPSQVQSASRPVSESLITFVPVERLVRRVMDVYWSGRPVVMDAQVSLVQAKRARERETQTGRKERDRQRERREREREMGMRDRLEEKRQRDSGREREMEKVCLGDTKWRSKRLVKRSRTTNWNFNTNKRREREKERTKERKWGWVTELVHKDRTWEEKRHEQDKAGKETILSFLGRGGGCTCRCRQRRPLSRQTDSPVDFPAITVLILSGGLICGSNNSVQTWQILQPLPP